MLQPFELEVMRDRVIYCMAVMDEKGSSTVSSYCLWKKDWTDLRLTLLELVNFMDRLRERGENDE